jgi:predicted RNA polymerase sigma factor
MSAATRTDTQSQRLRLIFTCCHVARTLACPIVHL